MPRTLSKPPKGRGPGAKRKKPHPQRATAGEKAAVATAMVGVDPPHTDEEQLDIEDLIGAPRTAKVVRLENKLAARGVGRPPGARNKRAIEWTEYLLARYQSPLEVLAQMAVARVDVLAAKLSCTKLEAFQEKRLAAIALVPYLHEKRPLAVNLNNRTVVHLTISEAPAFDVPGDELSLTARIVEKINGPDSKS